MNVGLPFMSTFMFAVGMTLAGCSTTQRSGAENEMKAPAPLLQPVAFSQAPYQLTIVKKLKGKTKDISTAQKKCLAGSLSGLDALRKASDQEAQSQCKRDAEAQSCDLLETVSSKYAFQSEGKAKRNARPYLCESKIVYQYNLNPLSMDPPLAKVSEELMKNSEIQRCYKESHSGKDKVKGSVLLNASLDGEGYPTVMVVISSPKNIPDKPLHHCIETIARKLKYPTRSDGAREIQVHLNFPSDSQ